MFTELIPILLVLIETDWRDLEYFTFIEPTTLPEMLMFIVFDVMVPFMEPTAL